MQLRLGWVPETEVPLLLAAADLVVLPYRSGSQSAVAPLALAAGLPVLSTRVGGLPEVVQDGINGVLVEPGSVQGLARAFEDLTTEKLDELAAGARASRSRLTWNGYAASPGTTAAKKLRVKSNELQKFSLSRFPYFTLITPVTLEPEKYGLLRRTGRSEFQIVVVLSVPTRESAPPPARGRASRRGQALGFGQPVLVELEVLNGSPRRHPSA